MPTRKFDRATTASVMDLLEQRYSLEPEKFRAFLPDIAQVFDAMYESRRSKKPPFNLTERERAYHRESLVKTLQCPDGDNLTSEQAIKAFEHCANLIRDDSLPDEVRYPTMVRLLKAAVGKSPGSFRKNETIIVGHEQSSKDVINRVSVIRGVHLELDRDMRLVSISVSPYKFRQRRKLLSIVGVGRDTKSDVSIRHDDYLAEIDPHGTC